MSEYHWYVKGAWIGVQREYELLGVIMRSGWCNALGHFCFVAVQVNGKKYTAHDAEARIFPFHSITLKEEDKEPEYILRAIGWCKDHETFAYHDAAGRVVKITGRAPGGVTEIPREIWPDGLDGIGRLNCPKCHGPHIPKKCNADKAMERFDDALPPQR